MIITTKTQEQIICAFIELSLEAPNNKVTIKMIGDRIGMSRENIYHHHFRGIEAIIERIHLVIDDDLYTSFSLYLKQENPDIVNFFREEMIPYLYLKKDWLKALYGTCADSNWLNFLENRYAPLVKIFLENNEKNFFNDTLFLSQIIIKHFISIISVWLTAECPESPSTFSKKFDLLVHQSPASLVSLFEEQ